MPANHLGLHLSNYTTHIGFCNTRVGRNILRPYTEQHHLFRRYQRTLRHWRVLHLSPKLTHIQPVIHTAAREQFIVLAALDHFAVLDDDDLIRVATANLLNNSCEELTYCPAVVCYNNCNSVRPAPNNLPRRF
jgi:hypothetical protein